MKQATIKRDKNGNKLIIVPGNDRGKGFSIQTNSILAAIFAMFKPLTKQEKRQAGIISASEYQKQKREK